MTSNKSVTYAEARALYRRGKWECEVPPVYTGNWTRDDWIKWIWGVSAASGPTCRRRFLI